MLFLGDLPKPIHGMSVMNQEYLKFLEPNVVINTAPSSFHRYFDSGIWKALKLVLSIRVLIAIFWARFNGERVCYRALNGGSGQIFDVIYLAILRLLGFRIFLHHHSFNYLNNKSILFEGVLLVAGKGVRHIVLGRRMKTQLESLYDVDSLNIRVVSNSVFFEPKNVFLPNNIPVLGYMSNLVVEKGVVTFIEMCELLRNSGVEFHARIAGPVVGDGVRDAIDHFESFDNFNYLGAVYGDDKDDFLSKVDIFILPSQYKNEAEPLVLYEAAQYGAFLVVSNTGCLDDVATALGGTSVRVSDDIVNDLVEEISRIIPSISSTSKSIVMRRLDEHIKININSLEELRREIVNASGS